MGFGFSLNETIVEVAILELGNNSYSSLWFLPYFTILNVFRKNHFRVWNPNSKYMIYIFLNNGILIEIKFVAVVKVLFGIWKFCLNYFGWIQIQSSNTT
jgi:hypothetical protein